MQCMSVLDVRLTALAIGFQEGSVWPSYWTHCPYPDLKCTRPPSANKVLSIDEAFKRHYVGLTDEEILACRIFIMQGDFKDADPTKDSDKVHVRHQSILKNVLIINEIEPSYVDGVPMIHILVEMPDRSRRIH